MLRVFVCIVSSLQVAFGENSDKIPVTFQEVYLLKQSKWMVSSVFSVHGHCCLASCGTNRK